MPTTRREFVKQSLLVGAATLAGSEGRAGPLAPPGNPPISTQPGVPAVPAGPPYPLIPYGSAAPIYLADLDRCQPASALATSWQPNRWRVYPYASDHAQGMMVRAKAERSQLVPVLR